MRFIILFEFFGVMAFAMTGFIEARKLSMDLVGVYAVSMAAAFGGGTIRDIMLGHYPLFWIQHSEYAVLLFLFAVVSSFFPRNLFNHRLIVCVFEVFDAVGLGVFCTAGSYIAHEVGCSFYSAMLLGVITAVFGGVLRDIFCNQIPHVFQHNELYATCASIGSTIFLLVMEVGISPVPAMLLGMIATITLRMVAIWNRILLPV